LRQLQARHGVEGIDEHDASMIENALELGGCLGELIRREVGLAPSKDRIQAAEASDKAGSRPRCAALRDHAGIPLQIRLDPKMASGNHRSSDFPEENAAKCSIFRPESSSPNLIRANNRFFKDLAHP
jgi:hypothetical protein